METTLKHVHAPGDPDTLATVIIIFWDDGTKHTIFIHMI